jgi:hypothetical protein
VCHLSRAIRDSPGVPPDPAAVRGDRQKRLDLEARGERGIWVSYRQVTELRDVTGAQLATVIAAR